MGTTRMDPSDWTDYSTRTSAKPRDAIFTSKTLDNDLDPKNIKVRESVDSPANPASTPIMLFVDQTGSMGHLAEAIIKHGLGTIIQEIYDRKPVTDPHLLVGAIGDGTGLRERAPLQASQFESDMAITTQIEKIFLEGMGGGNRGESYLMAWYFAAMRTACDAITKRGKKGYLFTIGDEPLLPKLPAEEIKHYFGDSVERDFTAQELYDMISPNWEVFHLNVSVGNYPQDTWRAILGERVIPVTDHEKLAQVIVSTLQVLAGVDIDTVVNSWSGDTSLVVRDAVTGLTAAGAASTGDVVRL